MKKKIIITVFSFSVLILLLSSVEKKTLIKIFNYLPEIVTSTTKFVIKNDYYLNKINNDYNKVFLPNTQFADLSLKKVKLDFIKSNTAGYLNPSQRYTFYIDIFKDLLIAATNDGSFFYKKIKELDDTKINFLKIKTNLKTESILDIFINDDLIYVSYIDKKNKCKFLNLAKSKLDLKILNFENIFSIKDECVSFIQSGRIQEITKGNLSYILLSTAADILADKNQKDQKPQSNDSLYGKTILIDKINNSYKIFSKGHRNILGMHVTDDNNIISTENGPKGGDEINLIEQDKNYGWDISSYGKKYNSVDNDNGYLDHEKLGFEEPIFSFLTSIGISEIVKIDDKFDNNWKDNFLISSLNYGHLLRAKINLKKKKIDYFEEIFIGERIRDLKYYNKNSTILLALENTGSIGIINKLND